MTLAEPEVAFVSGECCLSLLQRSFLGGLLGLAFASGAVQAQLFSSPDPHWQELEIEMPPPPEEASLREFQVVAASTNRFFIDESSLSVGEDGVVRYVLVVRAAGGAESVVFEGVRCATAERRIYAMGRADGEWAPARSSDWRRLGGAGYNQASAVLAQDYFCDGRTPPRSRDVVLRKMRDGFRVYR